MLPKLVAMAGDVPKTSEGKYNKRDIKTNVKTCLEKAKRM